MDRRDDPNYPPSKRLRANGNQICTDWHECCRRQDRFRSTFPPGSLIITNDIHDAAAKGDVKDLPEIKNFSGILNEHNYHDYLKTLLRIDEAYEGIVYCRYDMFDHLLKGEFITEDEVVTLRQYGVEVKGLSHSRSPIVPEDYVLLRDPLSNDSTPLEVESIDGDFVKLSMWRFDELKDPFQTRYGVLFRPNGTPYFYYDRALGEFKGNSFVKSIIFETCPGRTFSRRYISINTRNQELNERLDKLSEPQRRAVEGILAAECRPKPYIVFGPPGTGKTHTLVETAAQIYARNRKARILFSLHSNIYADHVVEKLKQIDLIPASHIHRYGAGNYWVKPANLSRIVVTTNIDSGHLIACYVLRFDYVFIDEAGYAHEPETLVPICCLKKDGCLVLTGDPKQLGPVVYCKQAAEHGLDKSMLERIFKFNVYQRDPETNEYNNKYITKLLHSYRCDPRILTISNKLFYDNELIGLNETPKSLLRILKLSGPVQFCHVPGYEYQPPHSTSSRNDREAAMCVDLIDKLYKMGFEPDQIGVISPYKLQNKVIAEKLNETIDAGSFKSQKRLDNWRCKIDTVEAFKDDEREIIIISTVRTPGGKGTDVVGDPRRFNTAMSRAKWLLFVVGHKDLLESLDIWSELTSQAARDVVSGRISKWSDEDKFFDFLRQYLLAEPNNSETNLGELRRLASNEYSGQCVSDNDCDDW